MCSELESLGCVIARLGCSNLAFDQARSPRLREDLDTPGRPWRHKDFDLVVGWGEWC